MRLDRYRAVFFDVGGTLLKVHPSVGHVYAEHARDFGFRGSPEALNRSFREAWRSLGGMESLGRKTGPEVERAFWREVVRRTFEPFGGIEPFDDYFERLYEAFRRKDPWRLYEDVAESRILERLHRRGVVMGVISNWDSRLRDILDQVGLGDYFRFVLASTVVGAAKPDPRIFQEGLALSGVKAQEACHIGDEPETDLRGAQAAGLAGVLVDRHDRFPQFPNSRVRSFLEFDLE